MRDRVFQMVLSYIQIVSILFCGSLIHVSRIRYSVAAFPSSQDEERSEQQYDSDDQRNDR